MEESDDIIEQNPVLALGLIVVIGAGAYAAISFVMRQTVNPLEVGLFAVIFAAVYAVFAFILRPSRDTSGRSNQST